MAQSKESVKENVASYLYRDDPSKIDDDALEMMVSYILDMPLVKEFEVLVESYGDLILRVDADYDLDGDVSFYEVIHDHMKYALDKMKAVR